MPNMRKPRTIIPSKYEIYPLYGITYMQWRIQETGKGGSKYGAQSVNILGEVPS